MDVTFQRKGEQLERHARVRLEKLEGKTSPLALILFLGLPAFCLALGFWVVTVRLRDPRAWLLLALMLSIATLFNSFTDFWGPSIRTLATIYFHFESNSWLDWLLLLGVYFPEPFPDTNGWRWWKRLAWTVVCLWTVFALTNLVAFAIELHSIRAAMPVNHLIAQMLPVGQLLGFIMVLS